MIGFQNTSIDKIKELSHPKYKDIKILRVVNSDFLRSTEGIQKFVKLKTLNLSSNMIERIENLDPLAELQSLDLSANRIRVISGLNNLRNLRKLNLSGNKIVSLRGILPFARQNDKLSFLDLSGNNLRDVNELVILDQFKSLKEVVFRAGADYSNFFCRDRTAYLRALGKLRIIDQLTVDRMDSVEIFNELRGVKKKNGGGKGDKETVKKRKRDMERQEKEREEKEKEIERREKYKEDEELPERDSYEQEKTPNDEGRGVVRRVRPKRKNGGGGVIGNVNELVIQHEILKREKKELEFKMETTEKYWINKVKNLEDNQRTVSAKLEFARKDLKNAERTTTILNEENKRLKDMNKSLQGIQSNSQNNFEKFEEKISELIKANGDIFRQCETLKDKMREIETQKAEKTAKIQELRRVIKDYESNLMANHQNSLQNNQIAVQRYEELSTRFRKLESDFFQQSEKMKMAENKNSDLYKENLNWENELRTKLREQKEIFEAKMLTQMERSEEEQRDLEEKFQRLLLEKESKFKNNIDDLENEFKKVLVDTTNKLKGARKQVDTLLIEKKELKRALELSIIKSTEQEELIEELGGMLSIANNEIKELKEDNNLGKEFERLEKENGELKFQLNKKTKKVEELKKRLTKTINELEDREREMSMKSREIYHMKLQLEEKQDIVSRIEDKFKNVESSNLEQYKQLMEKCDNLEDEYQVKTQICKDLTIQVQELKSEIAHKERQMGIKQDEISNIENNYEIKLGNLEDQYAKSKKKIDKSNQLLDEYEAQFEEQNGIISKLKAKAKTLKDNIMEKGQVIQDLVNENKQMTVELRERDADEHMKLKEIKDVKEMYNGQMERKDARCGELEEALRELKVSYEKKIGHLEEDIRSLRQDCKIKEEEIKVLLVEIHNQKEVAKEKLAKLTEIFT